MNSDLLIGWLGMAGLVALVIAQAIHLVILYRV